MLEGLCVVATAAHCSVWQADLGCSFVAQAHAIKPQSGKRAELPHLAMMAARQVEALQRAADMLSSSHSANRDITSFAPLDELKALARVVAQQAEALQALQAQQAATTAGVARSLEEQRGLDACVAGCAQVEQRLEGRVGRTEAAVAGGRCLGNWRLSVCAQQSRCACFRHAGCGASSNQACFASIPAIGAAPAVTAGTRPARCRRCT